MSSTTPLVIGIGEVLWDLLPDGKALGGAPANFCYIAHALGCDAALISSVGDDPLGHEALAALQQVGLHTTFCAIDPAHPTGTAGVSLRNCQPNFTIAEDAAWDNIQLIGSARTMLRSADVVCFGTLAQRNERSRNTIQEAITIVPRNSIRIFDCNLRQGYYSPEVIIDSLMAASVAKMNDAELPVLCRLTGCTEGSAEALRSRFDLDLVCVTLGERGCELAGRGESVKHAGFAIQIFDTIGAGDAFTSAMAVALLRGWRLPRVAAFANSWGSFVASTRGAMPKVTAKDIAVIERRAFS
jgi:fructokinase